MLSMEEVGWMNQRRESSGWGWWMKDKVKKVKVELIAKELGDVGTTPSKTSQNWNIQITWPRAPSLWTCDTRCPRWGLVLGICICLGLCPETGRYEIFGAVSGLLTAWMHSKKQKHKITYELCSTSFNNSHEIPYWALLHLASLQKVTMHSWALGNVV